jgi:hypothetical protein
LAKLDPHSEGIPFFPFFINPKSFGQSSENLFFISFLVRDGRAGLHLSGNDELIITHRQRYEEDEDEEAPGAPCQGVMEFDMETWRVSLLSGEKLADGDRTDSIGSDKSVQYQRVKDPP